MQFLPNLLPKTFKTRRTSIPSLSYEGANGAAHIPTHMEYDDGGDYGNPLFPSQYEFEKVNGHLLTLPPTGTSEGGDCGLA